MLREWMNDNKNNIFFIDGMALNILIKFKKEKES
jgi:hypothetical protein